MLNVYTRSTSMRGS